MTRPHGAPWVGAWAMIPDPIVLEALGRSGVDWVGLDLQHGAFDLGQAFRGIQLLDAVGVPTYVRVSQDELQLIPRVCDHGAAGVIVAMVESPAVAQAAVQQARYHPSGTRSYGGQRYGLRSAPDDVSLIQPRIYPMIESLAGLDAVEAIGTVAGIAGLHVGPVDLGLALGLGMDRDQPVWRQAVTRIVEAAHSAGITATMHAVTSESAQRWLEAGFDELILGADISLLSAALAQQLGAIRGISRGAAG